MTEKSDLLKELIRTQLPDGIPTEEQLKNMSDEEREKLFTAQNNLIKKFSESIIKELKEIEDDIDVYQDVLQSSIYLNDGIEEQVDNLIEKLDTIELKKTNPKKVEAVTPVETASSKKRRMKKAIFIIFVVLLLYMVYGFLFTLTYMIE